MFDKIISIIIILRTIIAGLLWCGLALIINCFYKFHYHKNISNKFVAIFAKAMLNPLKLKQVKIVGKNNINYMPDRNYMIMSNHTSLYDIPLILQYIPGKIRMLAKADLFKIPVFSKAMLINDFVPIHRDGRKKIIADLKLAQTRIEQGFALCVFPEGSRSEDGNLQQFKTGVFTLAKRSNTIIIPICIKGANNILPKKKFIFKRNQKIAINIGEPIDTRLYSQQQKLIKDVFNQIKELQ